MAPLPSLTMPSRAVLAATDMKDITARNQRQRTDSGLDLPQIVVCYGYANPGDCAPLVYKWVSAQPSFSDYVQSACGQYWQLIPGSEIDARHFGLHPSASAADNTTAIQNWAAYVDASSLKSVTIPFGTYQINGGFGFARSHLHIKAYGAAFVQNATSGVTADLNDAAVAGESVISNYIVWEGGYFAHAVAYATTSNTCTAIRDRGTSRCTIRDVVIENFHRGIVAAPREGLVIENVAGVRCHTPIEIEDWITTGGGNPQDIFITHPSLTVFYGTGIDVNGYATHLRIRDGFIIPDSTATGACIDIETADSTGSAGGRNVVIEGIDFEQGPSSSYFYINVTDSNTNTLRDLTIRDCSFASGSKVANIVKTDGVTIEGNYIASTTTGWLTIDSSSTDIHIGRNEFPGLSWANWPAITFSCARTELFIWPYQIWFGNDEAIMSGWLPNALSTATGTLDLSTLIGTNFPGIAPPLGYWFKAQANDSGSAAAAVGDARFTLVQSSSIGSSDFWQGINIDLAGETNDKPVGQMAYVQCDSSGDVYYDAAATGTGTLDVYLKPQGLNMGGGK